jgi:HEAT repeat protein
MRRTVGIVVAACAALAMGTVAFAQARHPSLAELLPEFETTNVSRQLEVSKQIIEVGDLSALQVLVPWLGHEDRHLRSNAALVFASLGDARGFETLRGILTDRSYRPQGQRIPGGSFKVDAPAWWLPEQIRADRSYAVHVLGQLKDPRAADILLPLLDDPEINYHVAWALGEAGDRRAIRPLIAALLDRDALVRRSAIQSLEKLGATEALPAIRALLTDHALPRAGDQVSVAETAKAAIAKLQREQ